MNRDDDDARRWAREEAAKSTQPEIAEIYREQLQKDDEVEDLFQATRERTGRKGLSDG